MVSENLLEAEMRKRLSELWREIHELNQEKLLLQERLRGLEERLQAAHSENHALRRALHGLRRSYLRSFAALAVAVLVTITTFFGYIDLRMRRIEKQITVKTMHAFREETLVGTVIRENYPDLYRAILKSVRNR